MLSTTAVLDQSERKSLQRKNPARGKMHAMVVEQFGKTVGASGMGHPVAPALAQILVKTEARGVCHTDLHAANGDWPKLKPTLPFIPGHAEDRIRAGGRRRIGASRSSRRATASASPGSASACGHCEYCLAAWETVCPHAEFGELHQERQASPNTDLQDPNYAAYIPKGLEPAAAAPLICAGVTTYKGIKESGAKPGEWMAISGAGGLGHLAIQYAKAMGLLVCAIDIDDGKLAHAQRLGADLVFNAKAGDPVAALKKQTGGGAHGVLITAPSITAFKQGVGMTRKLGTCVLVGLPPGEFPVPLFDVVANCITIRGSFVGTRQDMAEALAFAAGGQVGLISRTAAAVGDQQHFRPAGGTRRRRAWSWNFRRTFTHSPQERSSMREYSPDE